MAKTVEQLLQDLVELTERSQSSARPGKAGAAGPIATKEYKKYEDSIVELTKQVQNQIKYLKKANAESTSFTKMLSTVPAALNNLKDDLDELDERIEKEIDQQKKKTLQEQRDALASAAATNDNIENVKRLGKAMGGVAVAGLKSVGAFVKGLQSGQSGIELSTGLITAGLDAAGATSAAFGDTAGTAGQVMMHSTNPTLRALGATAAVVGPLLGQLGEGASKLAKFGVEVLSKEVEKTVKAYNDSTTAGALFAKGMDDLRVYSGQAGLTVDQYSNVLKQNSSLLAESGYTVSGAAKIVAGVTSNLATQTSKNGRTLQNELMNLGYGFEEQASLVAQMTSNLKKSGGTATNAQVAQATLEMGKNIRAVADILGEEAKQKMEQAKKESEQYAFFAKVREVAKRTNDPGLFTRVQQSMALMDETQRRAVMQATVMNGVVTDVGANLLGVVPAAQETANAILAGGSSLETLAGPMAKYGDEFESKAGKLGETISAGAIVGVDSLQGLAKQFDSMGQQVYKLNTENLASAVTASEKTADATGKLQNAVVGAETAAQDLKMSLQKELTPAISQFATVAKEMLGEVQDMLKKLRIGAGTESRTEGGIMSTLGNFNDWLKEHKAISTGLTTAGAGLELGGLALDATGAGAIAGVPLNILGAISGAAGFAAGIAGYADGGISTSKNAQGVLARVSEGGIAEAHVPLPDGKSIPVTIPGFASVAAEIDKAVEALNRSPLPGGNDLSNATGELAKSIDALKEMVSNFNNGALTNKDNLVGSSSALNPMDYMASLLDQFRDMHQDQMNKQDELIGHMRDTKDYSQRLLHASQ